MSKVDRFWSHEAQNIRCVRESDYNALNAELAALKAGQGEAVAVHQYRTSTIISWIDCHESDFASAVAQGFEIRTLYTAPPATGVIVPRELLVRVLSFMDRTNKNYPMPYHIREELRALLAQSQELKS